MTQLGFQKWPFPSCWTRPPGSSPWSVILWEGHVMLGSPRPQEMKHPGGEVHWLNPPTAWEP